MSNIKVFLFYRILFELKNIEQKIYIYVCLNLNIIKGGDLMVESDAVINGVFSFIIPGLGQAIEGYKARGLIIFIVGVIIAAIIIYLNFGPIIQYTVSGIYGLIAAYDAYRLY